MTKISLYEILNVAYFTHALLARTVGRALFLVVLICTLVHRLQQGMPVDNHKK